MEEDWRVTAMAASGKWAAWEGVLSRDASAEATAPAAEARTDAPPFDQWVLCPLVAGVLVFVVLGLLRPPFVLSAAGPRYEVASVRWHRVLIWSLGATLAAHVLPRLYRAPPSP